jgi:excisionase family DNA binding protein
MNENDELPKLPEYVSIKEAADMLNLSDKRVYSYVEDRRIKAVRAGNTIMIPITEIENFQFRASGRPRTTIPAWHIAKKENTLFALSIEVQVRKGQERHLASRLEEIRRSKEFTFPGTVARYLMADEQKPERVEMVLIWKKSIMPAEAEREQALENFRHALDDVFDWSTARYRYDKVYMHT